MLWILFSGCYIKEKRILKEYNPNCKKYASMSF